MAVRRSDDATTGVAVLEIVNPPVNALSLPVRRSLLEQVTAVARDPAVTAVVIMGAGGGTFPAGADIGEFSNARALNAEPKLNHIMPVVEACPKPVVAAIEGTALGGGLELALACHWRVATPNAAVGLPEVHIGLLPGAGGTQRLPRLVGVHAALKMIVGGAPVKAPQALELGVLDQIANVRASSSGGVEEAKSFSDLRAAAVAFAANAAADMTRSRRAPPPSSSPSALPATNEAAARDDPLASRRLSRRPVPLPTTLTAVGRAAALAACENLKNAQPPEALGGLAKRFCCEAVAASVRYGTHLEAKAAHRQLDAATASSATATDAAALWLRERGEMEALSFERGLAEEARLFDVLVASPQSFAKRHVFFAERAAGRLAPAAAIASSSSSSSPTPRGGPKQKVPLCSAGMVMGIVGAGTMGSGIAIAALAARGKGRDSAHVSRVIIIDQSEESLERSKQYIARGVASLVRRGRLSKGLGSPEAIEERLAFGRDLASLAGVCDLVVEAVFENLELKRDIFAQLDAACGGSGSSGSSGGGNKQTILATNTSTLDVDKIAAAAPRFDQGAAGGMVLGMHFFSPAHLMRLVEVVKGRHTSRAALEAVLRVTKAMGKVGVVVGNCDGFVGNRVLDPYSYEAVFLVEEGASPLAVDTALNSGKGRAAAAKEAAAAAASGGALLNEEGGLGGGPAAAAVVSALPFGMAMGPLEMADLAGGDIGHNVRRERGLLNPATRPVVTIPARLASSFTTTTTTTTTATQGVLPSSSSPSSSSSGGGGGGGAEAAALLVVPMRYCELGDALVDAGRVGHKTGKGWYNYTAPPSPAAAAGGAAAGGGGGGERRGRKPRPPPLGIEGGLDSEVRELIRAHRAKKGTVSDHFLDDSEALMGQQWPPRHTTQEIQERLLFGLVNEAFKVLEEGICEKPSDLDVIYVFGYGFPDWRGGPFFWADQEVGLAALLDGIRKYEQRFPAVPHWRPSALLVSLAEANAPLAAWRDHLPDKTRRGEGSVPPSARL